MIEEISTAILDEPWPEECGVVRGNEQVWVVISPDGDPDTDPLLDHEAWADSVPTRICRAVLEDGRVVVGAADEELEASVAGFVRRRCCGRA